MKKLLLAVAAVLVLASCEKKEEAAPAGTNVHITGNVKGFKQGKLYLARENDSAYTVIDTITINGNSAFESHLKLDSPEMLYLFIDRVSTNSLDNKLQVFAEPGDIKIETTLEGFYANAKVTASENQKLWEEYLTHKKRLNDRKLDLIKEQYEADIKKNKAKSDSLAKKIDRNMVSMYLAAANFAVNHADKEIAPYLGVAEIPNINLKYLLMIDEKLTPKMKSSLYGKQLAKLIEFRKKNDPVVGKEPAVPSAK
ncbi:hypothetical protein AM493_09845 [Flavobacterium akiainvivens]|uniref:DUF4369 domain-containing protein n=1 Tax=Flavobacterium akiainvivens TaxID=1202724 RepID=A0A0M8MHF6_9FLAO|nr:DUF4369 domain-containing protein [Flavobacterium akiainvivens]KOS06301.1 hypothetical protein AM493_09845 [Flavobacterium akiainvivens]SFQ16835.1 protein of unknown function [Flavobacterium akiainvivens]